MTNGRPSQDLKTSSSTANTDSKEASVTLPVESKGPAPIDFKGILKDCLQRMKAEQGLLPTDSKFISRGWTKLGSGYFELETYLADRKKIEATAKEQDTKAKNTDQTAEKCAKKFTESKRTLMALHNCLKVVTDYLYASKVEAADPSWYARHRHSIPNCIEAIDSKNTYSYIPQITTQETCVWGEEYANALQKMVTHPTPFASESSVIQSLAKIKVFIRMYIQLSIRVAQFKFNPENPDNSHLPPVNRMNIASYKQFLGSIEEILRLHFKSIDKENLQWITGLQMDIREMVSMFEFKNNLPQGRRNRHRHPSAETLSLESNNNSAATHANSSANEKQNELAVKGERSPVSSPPVVAGSANVASPTPTSPAPSNDSASGSSSSDDELKAPTAVVAITTPVHATSPTLPSPVISDHDYDADDNDSDDNDDDEKFVDAAEYKGAVANRLVTTTTSVAQPDPSTLRITIDDSPASTPPLSPSSVGLDEKHQAPAAPVTTTPTSSMNSDWVTGTTLLVTETGVFEPDSTPDDANLAREEIAASPSAGEYKVPVIIDNVRYVPVVIDENVNNCDRVAENETELHRDELKKDEVTQEFLKARVELEKTLEYFESHTSWWDRFWGIRNICNKAATNVQAVLTDLRHGRNDEIFGRKLNDLYTQIKSDSSRLKMNIETYTQLALDVKPNSAPIALDNLMRMLSDIPRHTSFWGFLGFGNVFNGMQKQASAILKLLESRSFNAVQLEIAMEPLWKITKRYTLSNEQKTFIERLKNIAEEYKELIPNSQAPTHNPELSQMYRASANAGLRHTPPCEPDGFAGYDNAAPAASPASVDEYAGHGEPADAPASVGSRSRPV